MSKSNSAVSGNSARRCPPTPRQAAVVAALGVVVPVCTAAGAVLPSSATPSGYSLATLAADTAVYNTGVATANSATPAAPNIPFSVFEGPATVPANTDIYIPIYYADNSAPVDPLFPASIANQATDAAYLDNQVKTGYGVSAFLVDVDGQYTVLNDSYIVGVTTPTLLDGTPGGTEYITAAAVLAPLSAGTHTVGYGGVINGTNTVFYSAALTVVPEPATVGLIAAGAAIGLGRRRTRQQ